MKINSKTIRLIIGIIISLVGIFFMAFIVGYNSSHKVNPSQLMPVGIAITIIGMFVLIGLSVTSISKRKNDKG